MREREKEKLPDYFDIEGAAFGIARLHSLYSLDAKKLIEDGVVRADIKRGIKATSTPSIRKLTCKGQNYVRRCYHKITFTCYIAWDVEMIGRLAGTNGLYNTMVDFYGLIESKYEEEERLDEAAFEALLLPNKLNITTVKNDMERGIMMHDQILVWACSCY